MIIPRERGSLSGDRRRGGVEMRLDRICLTVAAVAATLLGASSTATAALPPQASDQAAAHTHGPDLKSLDRRGRTPAATYEVDAHAPWTAGEYDGGAFTTDQPDLTTLPTVHAVYVYPSDRASRFSQFAAMFQADARQASSRLASYGRGVRFDERAGGYLDITVLRSKYNSKRLSGGNQFNLVAQELQARGLSNPNKKYAVWLDAGSQYCGQGHLYQDTQRSPANSNEGRTTAIVYRPYATTDPTTGGFCRGRTLLHEVGHNMGALQNVAPHAFDGAHCNDSAEDVMCYTSQTSNDTGGPVFDWRADDYWEPAATGSSTTEQPGWWSAKHSENGYPTEAELATGTSKLSWT